MRPLTGLKGNPPKQNTDHAGHSVEQAAPSDTPAPGYTASRRRFWFSIDLVFSHKISTRDTTYPQQKYPCYRRLGVLVQRLKSKALAWCPWPDPAADDGV